MALFDQITRTKVILPRRRADLITRPRLVENFEDLLDYRLFIVTAPAGFGKTSLLVDVAHQLELPVCWYAIDALDSDLHRFVIHFIAAIAQRFPDFGHRSLASQVHAASDSSDLDRLVRVLVNEIIEHIQEHFVIVLDDWHVVTDSTVMDFVNRFSQLVDENCHLVICSRNYVSLSDLSLMAGRGQVSGLVGADLAFRADEIQAFIAHNCGQSISMQEAEELAQVSEGWITGLLLSIQTMPQSLVQRLRLARVSGVNLYDYLARQVLDQQSPAVKDFLLRSSILEEFSADLCAEVLGPAAYASGQSWSELMEILVRNNLFVTPVDNSETWLRYHPLFQEFLQRQLDIEKPGEKVLILQKLAAVFDAQEDWDKAYHLYQRLDNVEAAADLIERIGLALVRHGRLATLAKWIDALPINLAASRPRLMSLRGIAAVMLGSVNQGLSLLNRAEEVARATDEPSMLARALIWRAVAHRFKGDYRLSLADANEAITLTRQSTILSVEHAEALRAKGMALYRLGFLDEAVDWLERALVACDDQNDIQTAPILLFELGMTYSDTGRFDQALACCTQALGHWQRTNNITWQANLLNSQGIICHLQGKYEQALAILEEALSKARQSGYARLEAAALISIGDIYVELEAQDAGLAAYKQARDLATQIKDNFLLFYLNLAEAALFRENGDYGTAQHLLDAAQQLAHKSHSCHELGLYQLEAGRLKLIEGQQRQALPHLTGALESFAKGGQRIEEIKAHFYSAVCHAGLGNEPSALAHLSFFFNLSADLESRHPMIIAGSDGQELLKNVKNSPLVGYQTVQLQTHIAQFDQEIPQIRRRLRRLASTIPFASPKITIKTLGKNQVLLDGKAITTPEWQTQKRVRELFFYLLMHPDGLTREAIGADLWPDSSSRQLKLQFKNTVYRLRRALDKDAILFDETEDRYLFNRQLDYEYDVELFLEELSRARMAPDLGTQVSAFEAAVNLYRGPYLRDLSGLWIWPERERLFQTYVEANLRLTELYLEQGDYHSALRYCQSVLAEDPTTEEAHRQAMRIHAAQGNQVAVIRQFERCRQVLLEELDVPVSTKTEKYFQSLVG